MKFPLRLKEIFPNFRKFEVNERPLLVLEAFIGIIKSTTPLKFSFMNAINILIIFGAKYLFVLPIIIALAVFFFQGKKKKKEMAILGIISLPLTYAAAKLLGRVFYDPRPFVDGSFIPLVAHTADNGFPSDHTLICAAIAALITHYNRRVGLFLWLLTLLVGISRVLAGVHYPVDILGSIIISILVFYLVYYFYSRMLRRYFAN